MTLNRLLVTATAATMIACPALALAAEQGAPADQAAPPAASAPAVPAAPPTPALPTLPKIASGPDVYEAAKASGQFTILVKAIDATNLKATIKSVPNITLFAPTDAAFNALPPGQLAKLMSQDGLPALQRIILYHIVGAPIDSTKMKGAKGPVATEEGQSVVIDGSNAVVTVNNADILEADVKTNNGGVLNAIDKVLVPSDSPYAAALAPASSAAPQAAPSGTQ